MLYTTEAPRRSIRARARSRYGSLAGGAWRLCRVTRSLDSVAFGSYRALPQPVLETPYHWAMACPNDLALVPRATVDLVELRASQHPSVWHTVWKVTNCTGTSLGIVEVWFPHDQFHRQRERFDPALSLAAHEALLLQADVTSPAVTTTIENAFLILRLGHGESAWRIFVRLRIEAGARGQPRPIVEAITAQRARFGRDS